MALRGVDATKVEAASETISCSPRLPTKPSHFLSQSIQVDVLAIFCSQIERIGLLEGAKDLVSRRWNDSSSTTDTHSHHHNDH